MTDHPITPPPELVQQWRAAASNVPATLSTDSGGRHDYIDYIATRAAQWGADVELEACCEWLRSQNHSDTWLFYLRTDRRPKPPSLKEQALEELQRYVSGQAILTSNALDTIRRALEALPE